MLQASLRGITLDGLSALNDLNPPQAGVNPLMAPVNTHMAPIKRLGGLASPGIPAGFPGIPAGFPGILGPPLLAMAPIWPNQRDAEGELIAIEACPRASPDHTLNLNLNRNPTPGFRGVTEGIGRQSTYPFQTSKSRLSIIF